MITIKNLSVLFYVYDLAALIESALGADAMRHTRLLAIRAGRSLRRAQRIMRTAYARAGFRVATFWIWHNYL